MILALLFYSRWIRSSTKRHPPGPAPWPLIGNIPVFLSSKLKPLDLLGALADQHGDIYSLRVVMTDVVILNSFQLIRDAFHHPDMQGRPRIVPIEDYIGRRNVGVAGSSGPVWQEHRQFVHTALRTTFASRSIGDVIHNEARTLVAEMAKVAAQDNCFDPHRVLNSAVSNTISVLLFGKAYQYSDPDFICLQEIINDNLQQAASGGVFIFIPFLAKVPFSPANKIKQGVQRFTDFAKKIVNEHRNDFDSDHPRDIIDLYLKKIEEEGRESSFDETNLMVLIGDLFGASSENTCAALKWSILYMMVYPDVQAKVRQELDLVVGPYRLPTLSDRDRLPYTDATLHEIQRMGQVSALGIAHACTADTTLGSYDISSGTLIVPNLWRLSRDGEIWNEPDQFRPERFLDKDGKCFSPKEFIPFSIGKRICSGESIARKELFVYFSSLLHQFTFSLPEQSPPPSLIGRLGLVYNTQSYETCALKRD